MAFADDAAAAVPETSQDEAVPNRREAALQADAGVHATLKTLRRHLSDLRSPDGSRTNPARTCQDLRHSHPDKESGKRWPLPPSPPLPLPPACGPNRQPSPFQVSTGSTPTVAAPGTPSGFTATWRLARPASLPVQPPSPGSPGGLKPVQAPASPSGLGWT